MVRFGESGIIIDGREIPFYSGSIHYWRIERTHWDRILEQSKQMGFDLIETYIPWSVHETEPGIYDFGEKDAKKDLEAFLTLCEQKGLWVIVRPGPHINAEMTLFGYPEWILADEEIQARTPQGTSVVYPYVTKQFAVPSYASRKFYREVEAYFGVLQPILKRHVYPAGNIVAMQADNETCYFFRERPYVMDYSADSVALYRHMLQEKYHSADRISAVYGKEFADFGQIRPPAGYDRKTEYSMEYYFDWAEYKEYQILYALERMVCILEKMDLGLPVFHNCAYQNYTPISVQRIERIPGLSVAGIDAYPEPHDTKMLKRRIRYLAGSSRLPFVPEFGSGSWFDRGKVLSAGEEEFGYLYAFMNGMKAVNFYMLAERDRWTGCPLTCDGRIRENYFTLFSEMLETWKRHEIYRYERRPEVLLLKNYDMGRLKACTSRMDPNTLSSNLFIQGPDFPAELFAEENAAGLEQDGCPETFEENWLMQVMDTLDAMHIDYDLSDCYIDADRMDGYRYVFAASYRQMAESYQRLLQEFAGAGGERELILGPSLPLEDRRREPCLLLESLYREGGKIRLLEEVTRQSLEELNAAAEYVVTDRRVECAVHTRRDSGEKLLWLANVSAQALTCRVTFRGKRSFQGIWNSQDMAGEHGCMAHMEPYSVSLWKVIDVAAAV